MSGKVKEKRKALRMKLIDAAEARIRQDGLSAIKARDLAAEAGCSVGAIYNVFGDLTELILAVNGRTFTRLGAHVTGNVKAAGDVGPVETLIVMAHAYLDFADTNLAAWRALFDVEMSVDQEVPEWYLTEMKELLGIIARPLAVLFPDSTPRELELLTRGLFSSVHGIVLLGLERRISAVPTEHLREIISIALNNLTVNITK